MVLTEQSLRTFLPLLPDPAGWMPPLTTAFARFSISTAERQAAFLAQVAHIELGFWSLRSLLGNAMLTSKSATSVAGSAFLALTATLTSLNLIPVAGIVLLLGIERLMKCRSLPNMMGNCVACVAVCAWEKSLDRHAMHQALSGKTGKAASPIADQI